MLSLSSAALVFWMINTSRPSHRRHGATAYVSGACLHGTALSWFSAARGMLNAMHGRQLAWPLRSRCAGDSDAARPNLVEHRAFEPSGKVF
jgi:hypothetical protein